MSVSHMNPGFRAGQRRQGFRCGYHLREYWKDYCRNTTFHGLRFLVDPRVGPFEVLFWILILIGACVFAVFIILRNWNRYSANPTVVALELDFRNWNISFPAATFCSTNRLNYEAAGEYIKKQWGNVDDEKRAYYMKFLHDLSDISYKNMGVFKKYVNDATLPQSGYADIVQEIINHLKPKPSGFVTKEMELEEVMTEFGLCFTINSQVVKYLLPGRLSEIKPSAKPPQCNYLNTVCYGKMVFGELMDPVRAFIHSPYDVIDSMSKYYVYNDTQLADIKVKPHIAYPQPPLKKLRWKQRRCHYPDETNNLLVAGIYSYHICKMQCRMDLSEKLCGCSAYFYYHPAGHKECNISGMACLGKHSEIILKLLTRKKEPLCNCLQQCDSVIYNIYTAEIRKNGLGYNLLSWSIEDFGNMRLSRDVLFGIEELLVSFGGTVGLFLGCSVQSVMEIVYFLTLRLLFNMCRREKVPQGRNAKGPSDQEILENRKRRVQNVMSRTKDVQYQPTIWDSKLSLNKKEGSNVENVWSLIHLRNAIGAPKLFKDLKLRPGNMKPKFYYGNDY